MTMLDSLRLSLITCRLGLAAKYNKLSGPGRDVMMFKPIHEFEDVRGPHLQLISDRSIAGDAPVQWLGAISQEVKAKAGSLHDLKSFRAPTFNE